MKPFLSLSFVAGLALLTVAGCSHGPMVQEFPDTASSSEEVKKFDSDMSAAYANQADVFAPDSYRHAKKDLDTAKEDQGQGRDPKDILHRVAEGRAYLARAEAITKAARARMEELSTARKQAIDAGADRSFPGELRSADDKLKDLTADFEKDSVGTGSSSSFDTRRSSLQADYLDLELKAITHSALTQAQDTLKQADKEGAEEFAPRTRTQTQQKIKNTEAFIVGNRHDTEQIRSRSVDAQLSADHLLKITREAKITKKASPEETALALESEKTQADEEQNELEVKKQELAKSREENAEQLSGVENLTAQRDRLAGEHAMEERFQMARSEFTDNEAEVYRQGTRITMRLKGLQFPAGKAELKTSNYPLMAKVSDVLKNLGKSTVTVEGHTDSDGAKAKNEKLSEARAQAVRSYLVSAAAVEPANITAVGYGDQKPLASNKSPDGKAQNRRVDVIVTMPDTASPDGGAITPQED